MRSIPELFGKVRGRPAAEHHCPAAFITKLDEWEQNRHAEKRSVATGSGGSDILAGVGGITIFYGLPFLALQIAGNLGGLAVATAVPAVAFTVMGVACIVNSGLLGGLILCYVPERFLGRYF